MKFLLDGDKNNNNNHHCYYNHYCHHHHHHCSSCCCCYNCYNHDHSDTDYDDNNNVNYSIHFLIYMLTQQPNSQLQNEYKYTKIVHKHTNKSNKQNQS